MTAKDLKDFQFNRAATAASFSSDGFSPHSSAQFQPQKHASTSQQLGCQHMSQLQARYSNSSEQQLQILAFASF